MQFLFRHLVRNHQKEEENMDSNGVQSWRSRSCCNRPPWLLAILTELDGRMRALAGDCSDSGKPTDSFAERAENYYQRQPELLRLMHDLHNHYLYLADRYCHAATANGITKLAQPPDHLSFADSDSDAESSLSFQNPAPGPLATQGGEALVVELVAKEVERALLVEDMERLERGLAESGRKTELQRSLLEVLESERVVLLGENARLGYRAEAAEEEGRELAEEAAYMRRRAVDLARFVMKMRDDHRVCLLGRKIDDLQAQVFGLEKRNRECYDAMARREAEKKAAMREVCHQLERLEQENARLRQAAAVRGGSSKSSRWWGRIRMVDLASVVCFFCGANAKQRSRMMVVKL